MPNLVIIIINMLIFKNVPINLILNTIQITKKKQFIKFMYAVNVISFIKAKTYSIKQVN